VWSADDWAEVGSGGRLPIKMIARVTVSWNLAGALEWMRLRGMRGGVGGGHVRAADPATVADLPDDASHGDRQAALVTRGETVRRADAGITLVCLRPDPASQV
jgi:hypothetical protein